MDQPLYKIVKVVLCGQAGVGKTSLLKRIVNDDTDPVRDNEKPTIGVDFKTLQLSSRKTGNTIRFQIWDTAGQERFRAVSSSYFRGSHIFLYVYDATNRASFDDINDWMMRSDWVKNKRTDQWECAHTPYARGFLVGNKCDLHTVKEISYEEGEAFAAMHDMVCFETSAKTGANVLGMFQAFADWMDDKIMAETSDTAGGGVRQGEIVRLYEDDGFEVMNNTAKRGCC